MASLYTTQLITNLHEHLEIYLSIQCLCKVIKGYSLLPLTETISEIEIKKPIFS